MLRRPSPGDGGRAHSERPLPVVRRQQSTSATTVPLPSAFCWLEVSLQSCRFCTSPPFSRAAGDRILPLRDAYPGCLRTHGFGSRFVSGAAKLGLLGVTRERGFTIPGCRASFGTPLYTVCFRSRNLSPRTDKWLQPVARRDLRSQLVRMDTNPANLAISLFRRAGVSGDARSLASQACRKRIRLGPARSLPCLQ